MSDRIWTTDDLLQSSLRHDNFLPFGLSGGAEFRSERRGRHWEDCDHAAVELPVGSPSFKGRERLLCYSTSRLSSSRHSSRFVQRGCMCDIDKDAAQNTSVRCESARPSKSKSSQ